MDGDPSAGNFFKNLFGPNVSIVSSGDANSVVARNNGLSVDEFFQPFSCVGGKEPLTSRDVGGNLHSVSNIKIQFKNLTSKNISQDEIDRRLQDRIDKKIIGDLHNIIASRARRPANFINSQRHQSNKISLLVKSASDSKQKSIT